MKISLNIKMESLDAVSDQLLLSTVTLGLSIGSSVYLIDFQANNSKKLSMTGMVEAQMKHTRIQLQSGRQLGWYTETMLYIALDRIRIVSLYLRMYDSNANLFVPIKITDFQIAIHNKIRSLLHLIPDTIKKELALK